MKSIYIIFFVFFLPLLGHSQQITLLTPLSNVLNETSGLIYLNQKLITHNDSGGEAVLYELDSLSGIVTRSVIVRNATNIDWEDLCFDSTYIYIADIGNNAGTRGDLKIYRILISAYFTSESDTVTADAINFSYSDQTDFTNKLFSTNFDAEALISYNDSLYIFTKNWGNNWTNIYALPKIPGNFQAEKVDSFDAKGLVTGATFNTLSNTILLSGYTVISAFAIEISNFNISALSTGTIDRYSLQIPSGFSYQIESITSKSQNQYYLTAEESYVGNSGLFRLISDSVSGAAVIEKPACAIFPNPASNVVHINYDDLSLVEIYNFEGALVKRATKKQIDISDLSKGVYIVIIKNARGEKATVKKMIIK